MIIDLREIDSHCKARKMKMEILGSLKLIIRHGDHWVSFNLKDGFYSLAIAPHDREAFTVNMDGQVLKDRLKVVGGFEQEKAENAGHFRRS